LNLRSPQLAAVCILALFSACATPPPPSVDAPPEYDRSPDYPHWAGRPVTWTKLGQIENWLAGNGPRLYPEYKTQADLELAEGRLALAKKDSAELSPAVLTHRLRASERGFHSVLEARSVPASLRERAEAGLAEIENLQTRAAPRAARAVPSTPPTARTPSLAIQPRLAWNAAPAVPARLTPAGPWSRITIHHSAKYSKDIGPPTAGNVAATVRDIQTVHMRDENFGDIGYHFLIDPAGRVWQGRSLEWQGAHAGGTNGANNVGNIGICLLGDFNNERPDPRALESLENLVDALCERHHIPHSRVYGHRQLRSTECPGDALMAWVSRYAAGATH